VLPLLNIYYLITFGPTVCRKSLGTCHAPQMYASQTKHSYAGHLWSRMGSGSRGSQEHSRNVSILLIDRDILTDQASHRNEFSDIIGFTRLKLQPMYTANWICKFTRRLLYGPDGIRLNIERSIVNSLTGQDEIGMHTDLLHFSGLYNKGLRTCHKYIWASRSSRPFGIVLDDCSGCGGKLYCKRVRLIS
jgi:hypothetical protein